MVEPVRYLKSDFKEKTYPNQLAGYCREKLFNLAEVHGTPTVIIDKDKLSSQYLTLVNALPNVRMHYAIKALPNKDVLNHLNKLGCYFDVATQGEIELLNELNITADKTIHTHPIKKDEEIKKAIEYGCKFFVIDNSHEIHKFLPYKDKVQLLIRISFRSQDAVVDLSRKFGCELDKVQDLISQAQQMKIEVSGLSFHVGSQVQSPNAHVNAIIQCLDIFKKMPKVNWKILDIGGGFPIEYCGPNTDINDFCMPINEALCDLDPKIDVLAEPGRFIAGPSAIQILSVVGIAQRQEKTWYYLDDGVYGVLSGQIYDHAKYPIFTLDQFNIMNELQPSVLAGPTCDSIDVIDNDILLPQLNIGDKLIATQVGAYTMASATEFNLYKKAKVIFICNEELLMHSNDEV